MIPTENVSLLSDDTSLLLNPKMPESEAARLRRLVDGVPPLVAHVWVATSGSSGQIKMVALSKEAILASASAVNRHLNASAQDKWCLSLPYFHVGGLGVLARTFLSRGSLEALPQWSAAGFQALCQQHKITLGALVAAQIADLVAGDLKAPPSLRAIIVGGGAFPEKIYAQARKLGWPVLPSYGMTETASQAATASLESLGKPGFPELELLPHLEARTEKDGRLSLAGSSLLTGYATQGEGYSEFIDPKVKGWFTSEDLVEVKIVGTKRNLLPKGRVGEFLKIGGESVNLPRLDALLLDALRALNRDAHQGTGHGLDAALIAYPDDRLGHVIHLAVTDLSVGEPLVAAFNAATLPFEKIRRTHLVDVIPRSSLGKLRRAELLAQLKEVPPKF